MRIIKGGTCTGWGLQRGWEMEGEIHLKDATEIPHILPLWIKGLCEHAALSHALLG